MKTKMFMVSQSLHWGGHLHLPQDNLSSSQEKVVYYLEGEVIGSDIAQILELLGWKFKIAMINMPRDLMKK